jgi:peptide/nickel transport system substrate-binding protein
MKLAQRLARAAGLLGLAAAVLFSAPLAAKTFRFANQGDVVSMDPHSLNESFLLNFMGNVYEPLVGRGKNLELIPLLATDWKQTAPTVWRFNLRKGVQFHDGAPFTADDVIFSYRRAQADGSDVKTYVQEIAEIRKINDHAIDIVTKAPFPILPDVISLWYMMSKDWSEKNRAVNPVDRRKGTENTASFKANGTGPFRLRAREPGVRTTLSRNFGYWGNAQINTNIEEVVFTPIGNAATRVAALLSGEIDMMEPVPVQDIPRLRANANSRSWRARSCARFSSAWTSRATSCCSRTSRAGTRSRTSACARRSTRRSTSTRSSARSCAARPRPRR